jgi:ABC-type Zn2+ transport system substrate-binding protein/surface adhesin
MINSVKVTFGETTEDSKKEKFRDAEMVVWIDEDNDLCLSVKVGKEIKMIFMAPEMLNGLVTMAMRKQHEASEMEKVASETEKAERLAV